MSVLKRNNVNVFGKGETPIVFAHGYGCDQNMWRYLTPDYAKTHKIVLFDYVGAGASDLSAFSRSRYATLGGYARDIVEISRELNLKYAVLVGHSVSSMIGVLAAQQDPTLFSKIVMVGPSPCYINDGDYVGGFERSEIEGLLEMLDSNPIGWAEMMAPAIMGNPERPELSEELKDSFCRTDPMMAQHFARVTFLSDNRADLAGVTARCLILQCERDAIAPAHIGEYIRERIANSKLVRLSATGHCPHLSSPSEVSQAIQEFLAEA